MALWGNSDDLTIAGSPTGAGSVTVVGTASSEFWTAGGAGLSNVPTGTTVLLDGGDEGFVVLEAELATDLFRVGKMSAVVAGAYTPTYSQQPISLKNDPLRRQNRPRQRERKFQRVQSLRSLSYRNPPGNGRISLSSNWTNVEILELGDVQTTPRKLSVRRIGIRNVIEVKTKF